MCCCCRAQLLSGASNLTSQAAQKFRRIAACSHPLWASAVALGLPSWRRAACEHLHIAPRAARPDRGHGDRMRLQRTRVVAAVPLPALPSLAAVSTQAPSWCQPVVNTAVPWLCHPGEGPDMLSLSAAPSRAARARLARCRSLSPGLAAGPCNLPQSSSVAGAQPGCGQGVSMKAVTLGPPARPQQQPWASPCPGSPVWQPPHSLSSPHPLASGEA